MQSDTSNYRIALSAASVAFIFVYIISATWFRHAFLDDPDTLLHITVGKWIVENGRFPVTDHFSYTAFGKPWHATDWIGELLFFTSYKIGQWRGVTEIVAATTALISAALCFYLATKLRLSVAFGLAVSIVALISPHFLARPVVFSYLLLAAWLILVLEIDEQDKWTDRRALILIPLITLWANVHGSFTFGLAVFYIFISSVIWNAYLEHASSKLHRLVALLLSVTIAAVFVTPYGPISTLKTVTLLRDPAVAYINEWHAPEFQNDPIHLIAIVGLFGLISYLGIRLRGPRLLTLLLVTIFALEHKRGLGLFALVAPLLLVRPLCARFPWIGAQDGSRDPVVRIATRYLGVIAFVCASAAVVTGLVTWTINAQLRPPLERSIQEALTAAKKVGIEGNLLNTYGFGGYLIFNGVPTFVDGRVELYGKQFLQDYFEAMYLTKPEEVARIVEQNNIRWALLQPKEPIAFLLKADGWTQVYSDQSAIVLKKSP